MKKLLLSLIALVAMAACTSTDEPPIKEAPDTSSKYLTSQEAVALAQKALVQFGVATPSRSYRTAQVELFNNPRSRTAATDTTFYIVNFTDGGFALVAADKTAPVPVFGFSGEGSFEYSEDNGTSDYVQYALGGIIPLQPGGGGGGKPGTLPLKPADQNCPGMRVEDENGSYCRLFKRTVIDTLSVTLPTKWGQGSPYNLYAKSCQSCGCPSEAGCVPVAIGQLCAYYKKQISVDGNYMDWNMVLDSPVLTINTPSNRILPVAKLLRQLGDTCHTSYHCALHDGSGTTPNGALDGLRWAGFQFVDYTFNFMDAVNQMNSYGPTFMAGNVKNDPHKGHAWVTDGYIKQEKVYETHYSANHLPMGEESEIEYYLHMNWGWNGVSDGYFFVGYDITLGSPEFGAVTFNNFRYVKNLH